ncbi:MAG: sulfatase-like hydrolase/transferase, partial [Candidatus Aminicenantes bacterium]
KEKLPRRYEGNSPKYLENIRRYDTEIRYTDEAIKQLMDCLQTHGLTKKLVTCITADHGEQHGEHGFRGVHYDFYSENTFVPLIFHGCGIPRNKIKEDFVSTMDIAETLLSTAGLKFNYKTEGINLLASGNRSNIDRDFLIIGNPWNIKSLQLIRLPLSYILNFDRFYKYWYISKKEIVPGNLFKKIKKENLRIEQSKTFNQLIVDFPDQFRENLYYVVVKVNLEEKNLKKRMRVIFNKRLKTELIKIEKTGHLTVFHPVTSQDRRELKINFFVPPGTKLKNIEYSFLSEQEFANYSNGLKKLENKIHSRLNTQRKNSNLDELYDLKQDMEMNKNLLQFDGVHAHKDKIAEYRKSLYQWFEFYFKKGKKLIGKHKRTKLTPRQIEMLKSLGYL